MESKNALVPVRTWSAPPPVPEQFKREATHVQKEFRSKSAATIPNITLLGTNTVLDATPLRNKYVRKPIKTAKIEFTESSDPRDDLDFGQKRLREALARAEFIAKQPGVKPIDVEELGRFSLTESKIAADPWLRSRLAENLNTSLELQTIDIHGTVALLRLSAYYFYDDQSYTLSGTVYGTDIQFYTRSLIPKKGLDLAKTVYDAADALFVIDPIHGAWHLDHRDRRPIVIQLTRLDPMLVSICRLPYSGLPGEKNPDLRLFNLCQW